MVITKEEEKTFADAVPLLFGKDCKKQAKKQVPAHCQITPTLEIPLKLVF